MLSDTRQVNSSSLSSAPRLRSLTALLVAALVGIALLATITVMGPTSLAGIRLPWLAAFLTLLAGASGWWALYLWLLNRLGGVGLRDGLNRSTVLIALLSLSLLPDLAVFLSGKLPYSLPLDADLRSIYVWLVGLLVFGVFVGQELVLAGAVSRKGLRGLLIDGLRRLSALPRGIAGLPSLTVRQVRHHPLLAAILMVGIVQRWVILYEYHPGDMNDLLSVAHSILSWTPWGYYHYYRPQTYIFAHLPLLPMLVAPLYWFFDGVAKLPTFMAVKLISAVADVATAILIYSQARGRWKGSWGLILAGAWMLSPLVASSDDRPVCVAAAFTIAAFSSLRRPWLCGIMIALGVATRTEVAFLALPLIIHFTTKRELREKVVFLGAFLTTLAVVALPFVLTDPEAIDFAMRRQGNRQASGEMSTLLLLLQTHLTGGFASVLQQNPSLFPAAVTLTASLLAFRDSRVVRVALVVSLAYIMTIPVLHPHYTVFSYAAGIFYAAFYSNPLVAVAIVAATWPAGMWGPILQPVLAVGLAVLGLLRLDRPRKAGV